MGRSMRWFAAVALVLGSVAVGVLGGGAEPARAATRPPRSPAPPAPAPGGPSWEVDRVRFEPVRSAGVSAAGIGSYRGALEVVRTAAGGLAVINDVAFEDYLKGISEVPSGWPLEALKAQAIAARTYALWDLTRPPPNTAYKAVGADICATQACQVYTGLAKEQGENGPRWTAAVEATSHQALWWKGGPIVAKYSSSNGGQSVAGGQPYLRAVNDPDDVYSPLHQWQVTIPTDQLAAAFGFGGKRVVAIQRSGDQILVTAQVDPTNPYEEPDHITLQEVDFRDRVNGAVPPPAGLPKTLPTVRFQPAMNPDATAVVFSGRGYGHGIGLSQWGAFGKALRGMKAPDILASYYAGLKPVALPDTAVPATIKVAVDLDRGNAPVEVTAASAGGRLRLVGADGSVLAHGAAGRWRVQPAKGGRLTVVALDGQPQEAVTLIHRPDGPKPSQPIRLTLHLADDASFAATAIPPGGTAVSLGERQLFAAGDVRVDLTPATTAGPYTLTVDTDRGGGRVATTTFTIDVAGQPGRASRSRSGDPAAGAGPGRPGIHGGLAAGAVAAPTDGGPAAMNRVLAIGIALVALLAAALAVWRTAGLGLRRLRPLH